MDTIRYFKVVSKAELSERRSNGDSNSRLQQVQHQVAQTAGYVSWAALLNSSEIERQLAVAMNREPHLTANGFGPGTFAKSARERQENFVNWRAELRGRAERVEVVRHWLEQHVDRRQTVNPSAGSYGLKHLAETDLGSYVSNGELIAAAIIAGYSYRRGEGMSPNATFGMSAKSISALRSRLGR